MKSKEHRNNSYPPIGDYAYIADCHSSALVSTSGSIDWCCMPRVDSASCFGRILDWEKGGYCRIAPEGAYKSSRRYLEKTLILETIFYTEQGKARLIDCFPMRKGGRHNPRNQILRIVEGIKGSVDLLVDVVPRFDYGAIRPWIRRYRNDHYIALGGKDGLLIAGTFNIGMKHRHHLTGRCAVKHGQRAHLAIIYRRPEELDEGIVGVPDAGELDRQLEETIAWWHRWSAQANVTGPYAEVIQRSAIILKGLSNAPTGAIAAAATSSLPESPGGSRNWDYRFTWIRDSSFTVRSLAELGYVREADGFRRFVERTTAGSADELQILFGMGGERRLKEQVIDELSGYRGAHPVRVGNDAEKQIQLDVYGELLELAWNWHMRGRSPDDDYWEFLVELINAASLKWNMPDQGIWEMRGEPRHFVQSKAMCWIALDRGIRLAESLGRDGPIAGWKRAREDVRRAIDEKGYDKGRGVFIQAFDHPGMDASLLLLPIFGFVNYTDERMVRTTDAIMDELGTDGLLYRYSPGDDGMEGEEGVFLACSFWLVKCLAYQDRLDQAHKIFRHALSAGNDLGLFSEEYLPEKGEMLGNFPQGLTHLSIIEAAIALAEREMAGA
jgi:GH15 family glucan-1,4-alpha-glucosidase